VSVRVGDETIKIDKDQAETVYVPGTREPARVKKTQAFSMRGLEQQHQEAARRFATDYEAAYAALASPEHKMKVDGGGGHAAHLKRIGAQERLRALREKIGHASYTI